MAIQPLTSWLPVKSKTSRRKSAPTIGLERLEDRTAPAIYLVNWDGTGADTGRSLQEAIVEANLNPGVDQIVYEGGAIRSVVTSANPLPAITDTVIIDGFNNAARIQVQLDSASAVDTVQGFLVAAGGENSVIRNLIVTDPNGNLEFNGPVPEYGVKVTAPGGGFSLVNVDITKLDGDAVYLDGSANNTIGGSGIGQQVLIQGNNGNGVRITGAGAKGNLVQQTTIQQNGADGILLDNGASNNFIGDVLASSGNLIIQNGRSGIHLNNSSGNTIQTSRIGTDGTGAKANSIHGIFLENGSANNTIGGTDIATTGNKIAGNASHGIYIKDKTSSGNRIQSNLIGLNDAGKAPLANGGNGIFIENAAGTLVGNTSTSANYISGNALNGIAIVGADSAGTVVVNNRIGLNVPEDAVVSNTRDGILVNGATSITIGGGGSKANNFIGGNRSGIAVVNGSSNVTIQGNQIGLNFKSTALGNLTDGILVDASSNVQIGGSLSGTGNTISGNVTGVRVQKSNTVTLQANFIGTNLTGDKTVPNSGQGVIVDNSTNVSVGTPGGFGGNLISGNLRGVDILNGSDTVRVQNNRIGTLSDPTKVPDLFNLDDGVAVSGSTNVTVGGSSPLSGNTIAGNANGVLISNLSNNVIVQGNLLRNNSGSGVRVENSSFVTIGGETVAARNTIANTRKYVGAKFQINGVLLMAGANNNVVQGNWVGTDSTLDPTFGNRGNGILIDGAFNNLIGGTNAATQANVIAYNWQNGIAVITDSGGPGSAFGNQLLGNSIYSNHSFKFGGLGINLNTTGAFVDLNDAGDADLGANNTQNFPVITRADVVSGTTVIDFTLNSTAGRTYRIEFFGSDEPNQSGTPTEYGQGKQFLGSMNVTTDGSGNVSDQFTANVALQPLWVVSATATDQVTFDTSEFSQAMYVNTPGPNTYVVNNDGGFYTTLGNPNLTVLNGTMTLARAITLANQHPGTDRIFFALRPQVTVATDTMGFQVFTRVADSRTVLFDSNLPDITDTVVIDGSRLAWPQNPANVPYPGAPADAGLAQDYTLFFRNATNGLVISDNQLPADNLLNPGASAQFVVIRNFPEITGTNGVGITIKTALGGANVQNIQGPGGLTGLNGINGFVNGAVLIDNSPNNIIGGADVGQGVVINKIGTGAGVQITGAKSTGNLVQQTKIGNVFGVGGDGILIDNGASSNVIGGFTISPVNTGNQIVNSNKNGIRIRNSNSNRIQRNLIGNDGADKAMPNALNGIFIEDSSFNLIGGENLTASNLISGNTENGIRISGVTSVGNKIQSNFIGLNGAGKAGLPNSGSGVFVDNAPNTEVGSTTTAANYISGNNVHGVRIEGAGAAGTFVVNNRIGIDFDGKVKVGNVQDGVYVSGAKGVTVGGGGTNAVNIIGGNRNAVAVVNGSEDIIVQGNWLGLNKLPDNTYPNVGNLQDGVFVQDSTSVQIGGTQALEGNKIASNRNGIQIINSDNVTLEGNFVGTNLTGTIIPITVGLVEDKQPVFQAEDGVRVEGSTNIFIGTPAQGGGNLLSHNRHGVSIIKGSSSIFVQNNRIGTQSASPPSVTQHDLFNLDDGVFVDNSTDVLIGGTGPSNGNIIASNLNGIRIAGGSKNVTVQANLIRNNRESGVRIEGSTNNLVGGNVPAAANTINNRRLAIDTTFNIDGVLIVGGGSNTVQGNYIGTDKTGITTAGNTKNGVLIDGSSNNLVGEQFVAQPSTATPLVSNTIAYNGFNGVAVIESSGAATGNRILGNSISENLRLAIDLDNIAGDVTPNDTGDADGGANNRQNFPALALAESDNTIGVRIQGVLNSTANTTFRLEFFHIQSSNPNGNPPGYGQAKLYLGSLNVTTDANGDASYTFTNANIVLPASEFVAATATDLSTGDTSEVSQAQVIVGAPGPATYVVNNDGNYFLQELAGKPFPQLIPPNGNMTLATAIRLANEHPGADRIVFSLHPQYTNIPPTYVQESRFIYTNGDVPDITETLIIDGSYLAWPQVKGGDKRFDTDYTVVFKGASRGFRVSDNATPQSLFSNPNAKAEFVVIRHLDIFGRDRLRPLDPIVPGIGVELASKWGNANLQDIRINGFGGDAVRIVNSPGNIVGGSGAKQAVQINVVSGTGVNIIGAASTKNVVQQTNIGTPYAPLGNLASGSAGGNGIWIQGADNNTIGGFQTGTDVKIHGSGSHGIYLLNSNGTIVQRAEIGDPTNQFPNRGDGIRVENSGTSAIGQKTLIGGVTASAGNQIAGNTENGINVFGANSKDLLIQSNVIGTTAAPNSGNGILIDNVAGVLIGSTVTAANTIDGNNLTGIVIRGAGSAGARIVNTSVGKLGGNVLDGILVDGTSDVIIGGSGSNTGGTIAGNRRGVSLLNGASKVTIQGYTISGNSEEGVRMEASTGVLVGGTVSALAANTITGNRDGVRAVNSTSVTVQGNTITGQSEDGVIIDSTGSVDIGSPSQFGGNTISGNRNGVRVINGSTGFTIQNNTIGNNSDAGVRLDGITGAIIGGTQALSPNFVFNNRNGLHLTNKSGGATILGNQFAFSTENGILLEGSSDNVIGGQTAPERNVISGNGENGILIGPDLTNPLAPIFSNNNKIQGNYIGVDPNGVGNFGNGIAGIYIDSGSNNLIGGKVHDSANKLEQGNVIANSGANGVSIVTDSGPATGNSILGNSIFLNGLLGIDLGGNLGNVNFNDKLDIDTGANNLQNFPTLTSVESNASTGTRVQGSFSGTPNRTFRVEFFHIDVGNPNGNPPGYGQGKNYLGFLDITTDGSGDATFIFADAALILPPAEFVSATATDLTTGDTSEFGLSQGIVDIPGPVTYVVDNDGGYTPTIPATNPPPFNIPAPGDMTLAKAIRLANEHPGADRIVFNLPAAYTVDANGTITYLTEVRFLFTNGDLPDITDTVLIDGSPFATPQTNAGGNKNFDSNYTVIFNAGSHGFRISDNATAASKASNPNAKAELVVIRHLSASGGLGVGVELGSKYGGANLQDVNITGFSGDGVRILNSPNNIVGGSGAGQTVSIQAVGSTGVNIVGAGSSGNLVQQAKIGTAFGPGGNGIWIQGGANNNTIGGFVAGTEVSIQAANFNGIFIQDSSGTRIQRSTIGDPTNKFPNRLDGIHVQDAPNTLIGGVSAAAGNTIVANTEQGIHVLNLVNGPTGGSAGLQIQSNTIGSSTAPNSGNGIFVENVGNVKIGSTVTAANVVNGNNLNGILVTGAGSAGLRIVNTSLSQNVLDGIVVQDATDVVIGGTVSKAGGTISASHKGIALSNVSKVTIQQYSITGNSEEGIWIDQSTGILIGGTSSSTAGNKITGNRDGVRALNSDVVTLQGNTITGQSEDGVIIDGTGNVAVGSPSQFGANAIGGNRNGVRVINGSKNFTIQNNLLDANSDDAILLDGITGAVVGGILPLSGNKATNNRNGLHLINGTNNTTVIGNTFSNSTENGISLQGSSSNTIGGDTAAERNVVFSNALNGIFLAPDFTNPLLPIFSDNNVVQGNFIGVNATGTGNFGNGNAGIYIDGGNNNLIGGFVHDVVNKLEEGNIIANSGKNGVAIVIDNGAAVGNRVFGNSIHSNGLLGIDLGSNLGLVDLNDPLDADGGANNLQNFPEITFAEAGLVSSIVQGKLHSTPSRSFRIEFFGDAAANPNGTPPGYGQGRTFLGFTQVTTDGNGDATFNFFAPVSFAASGIISATATDLTTGDTSEFAESKQVQIAVGKIEGKKYEDLNGNGSFDAGEPGLPGWVIELEVADSAGNFDGKVDAKATTDASGNYAFATLTDGTYKLAEVLQQGWVQTAGPVPNPMQITGGATISNADFGNFEMMKVFGVKFEDKNGNAIRDIGEAGIQGVTINLLDAKSNTVLTSTATDLSGNYAFTGLFVGKFGAADTGFYRVREVVPPGFVQTTPNPPDFQIVSGQDVGPLDFGNKGGGGPGAGGGNNIIVVGVDRGRAPQVKVYSAQTGAQLFNFFAYDKRFIGGVRVASGDVTGDGILDIITGAGAGGGPHVKVFDGNTGAEIQSFMAFSTTMRRGVYVAAGDVNGDLTEDIIVGTGAGISTRVKAFDGLTGIELFDFTPYNPLFRGGVTVAAGDVNGDGFADIITGAGPGGGPHVRVFDGSQFGQGPGFVPTELWGYMAYDPRIKTGVFVTSGNLNGDKRADIITGLGPGLGGVPQIKAWDGGNKTELYSFYAFADSSTPLPNSMFTSDPRYVTGIRVSVVDFDNDGIDDIAAGPGRAKAPRVRVYDGDPASTHGVLFDALAFDPAFLGGIFVG